MDNQKQYEIFKSPKLEIGKYEHPEEIKETYYTTYGLNIKANYPEAYTKPLSNNQVSSIVLDIPVKKTDFKSEAMSK